MGAQFNFILVGEPIMAGVHHGEVPPVVGAAPAPVEEEVVGVPAPGELPLEEMPEVHGLVEVQASDNEDPEGGEEENVQGPLDPVEDLLTESSSSDSGREQERHPVSPGHRRGRKLGRYNGGASNDASDDIPRCLLVGAISCDPGCILASQHPVLLLPGQGQGHQPHDQWPTLEEAADTENDGDAEDNGDDWN